MRAADVDRPPPYSSFRWRAATVVAAAGCARGWPSLLFDDRVCDEVTGQGRSCHRVSNTSAVTRSLIEQHQFAELEDQVGFAGIAR